MKKIILIALLFYSIGLNAQNLKPYFKTLSVEDGLPEGYVVSSLQDKLGFIWLGTQNGLVRYDGYNLKSYSFPDENGIPLIYCSLQQLHEDKTGKLWAIVGNSELYYFDRPLDTFIKAKLNASDSNIFADHYIYKWLEDPKTDTHWFLAMNAITRIPCIYSYDGAQNKLEKYSPDGKSENYIPSHKNAGIIQDAEGKIWIAADSLLSFFEPLSKSFKPWFVIPDSTKKGLISGITADPVNKDKLWIYTFIPDMDVTNNSMELDFYQFNTKTKAFQSFKHKKSDPTSIAGNCIAIRNDSLNRTWFSTEKGISLFNSQLGTFTNFSLNIPSSNAGNMAYVSVIAADKEGNLWLAGNFNGLFYLDVNTAKATFYSHSKTPGSLPDSPRGINKLFYDRSGTFWISLPWRGIAYIDQQKTMLNPIRIEPTSDEAHGILSKDDFFVSGKYSDSVFFVNNNSGLFKWNYKQNSFDRIELNNNKVYNQIRTVLVAQDGLIWIGSADEGLFSYNPLNKSIKNFTKVANDSTSISSNAISRLIEDREGNLWIGTNGQGLCRFNKKSASFTSFPFISNNGTIQADNVLDDDRVLFMYIDNDEILWIGTNRGALNRFDTRTEKFTSYLDHKSGFNCVANIFEDSQQRMWCGTYLSGLFLIDTETGYKKRYSTQNGLIHNSVFGISEDNEGNIWIASFRGLSRLNPESDHITNFRFSIGDLRDPNILFTDSDGWLQLAIENGLITFDPEKLTASPVPPATVIESVSYRNDMNRDTIVFTHGKTHLELKYNENKVSFQYVGLHYANAELNQYAYKLEGYDKEWIEAGTQRSATYTNLSPGEYTFNVKSANSDGIWNETGSGFSIQISSPWWQTTLAYVIYGILFIAVVIIIDRVQRKRLKEKEQAQAREKELAQAKKIENAYNDLEVAHQNLKATQSQLIQSEKMASLGELTAGIAHEIQNPLNFVNNFSEVNSELIAEMREEIGNGNMEEVMALAIDIEDNERKINHHGKRADAIVKGMLQHSRSSSGVKEPTDINALTDEYLRLAYHGLRAKDKSFNASMKTNFDPAIGNINVIPQDMGRVILNLITNAFYAVDEKKKMQTLEGFEYYEPTVSVSTKLIIPPSGKATGVEISVNDNGSGIPKNVLDKIFQPFFTTKPTGQGTGLGLSMSYDIVKAHGGELKVETKEGEGTSFTIFLAI
ncbi:MAG: hypothetical protein COW63_08555 [Bacteroidetes bacterium CG18_big_fil_WC_8_21_14_2_50_41_14]|nr:MAG: hypothetical protein COW63_08555 [Bacteroidetes bacterium CG18_big_fil_WC_8_21_14_2_50_41_14]